MRVLAAFFLALAAAPGQEVTYPERPKEGAFVADEARLLTREGTERIRKLCRKAQDENRVPILVVTLRSLADHGARDLAVEDYARRLFRKWGIGSRKWNYGILFLTSVGDRKTRIELGGAWEKTTEGKCRKIMEEKILPQFKVDEYEAGIVKGVEGLLRLKPGRF